MQKKNTIEYKSYALKGLNFNVNKSLNTFLYLSLKQWKEIEG